MSAQPLSRLVPNLDAALRRLGPDVLRPSAQYGSARIGASASSRFMREGRSETGPNRTDTLRRRSARLARSLTQDRNPEAVARIRVEGDAVVLEKGTAVPYAAVHEFGFEGTVSVRTHRRRQSDRDTTRVRRRGFKVNASSGVVFVAAHERRVRLRRRPFLRPALAAEAPAVQTYAERRLKTVLREALA